MDSLHLTRELLRAFADRTRNPGDLVSLVMAHLFDLCPTCAEEFAAFQDDVRAGEAYSFSSMLAQVQERVQGARGRIATEKTDAQEQLGRLLELGHEERLEVIRRSPSGSYGPALAMTLLEKAREAFIRRPEEARELTELARATLAHECTSSLVVELYAQALAYTGNVCRILGDPQAGVERFECARFLLRLVGGGDRSLRAEIDSLEGSLLRDLRKFEQATRYLQRAATTYLFEEDALQAAQVFVNLSTIHNEMGEPRTAIEIIESTLERLGGELDPTTRMYCEHNLAIFLTDAGDHPQAAAMLEANKERYPELAQPMNALRVAWLEGKIARGLGRPQEARFHYLHARQGFLSKGIAYDAALVTLELAGLYLEERRFVEVKELAAELVAEFTRQKVSREAAAALMLFEDVARMERLTPAFIAELSTYLLHAQRDPSLVFQAAS